MNIIHVNLGASSIDVPVYDVVGKKPGKTLLVTGGMDGDEYAGMEACYRLIGRVKPENIAGRLIIIPIVNTPGFWEEKSVNPIDGKFPKFAGVGKALGSPTQRLVHWLVDTYAKHADLWLDLHGGSRNETLAPCLWAGETKIKNIDQDVQRFIAAFTPQFGIFERRLIPVGKDVALARMGCRYIVGEAGGSGRRLEKDIRQHESWITAALGFMGMMASKNPSRRIASMIYQNVDYITSKKPGCWFPADTTMRVVGKGEPLGVVRSLDGGKTETIRATHAGQLLWVKDGMRALPTDDLAAIAHNSPEKG